MRVSEPLCTSAQIGACSGSFSSARSPVAVLRRKSRKIASACAELARSPSGAAMNSA
jgi:hypothetical protein